ncbi:MAG: BrnT family toxin [Treponema sp.]|nr:BrnT family toxin [Spirochaetia bacterium]MDD7458449.1 BrnT family toxin [Spirochaetales bacterium]MDY5812636.1 BrnT family toxin [Treponema sp.]MEE1181291.1 BrnT family toxin [Treponema sp.]
MPKGELVTQGCYEWFSEKNEINKKKHGISFEEVVSIFKDPYFYEIYDAKHSVSGQERYIGFGYVNNTFSVVQINYTEETKVTHIISARCATTKEREMYYERLRKIYS